MQVEDPGGQESRATEKKKTKNKTEFRGTGADQEVEAGGPTSKAPRKTTVRRDKCESLSSTRNLASLQVKFARGYQKPCRVVLLEYSYNALVRADAFEKEMRRDVTHMGRVEVREEFSNKTFTRHPMHGTGEVSRRNERVHAVQENYVEYRFNGTRYGGGADIYGHGAMTYITNPKNHSTLNLKRLMMRSMFALCPDPSRESIRAILNGITKDCHHEQEIDSTEKRASKESTNEAYRIRAATQEHRAVFGLVNPADKLSDMRQDEERCHPLILHYFVFLNREFERKAEMELGVGKNDESLKPKAALLEECFDVVPARDA